MSSSAHSSLLHATLQNLHIAQQQREKETTTPRLPGSASASEADPDSDDEYTLVNVGENTRPGTPVPGTPSRSRPVSLLVGSAKKDPLRTLPTTVAVRLFLNLDVKSLSKCQRVCKRWHKSSTMNYVWFLQTRSLLLPSNLSLVSRRPSDDPDYDPYERLPPLSLLPTPKPPTGTQLQWSKAESKKTWNKEFGAVLKADADAAEGAGDGLRVDIEALSSGYTTPTGGHAYSGLGSGGASKWAPVEGEQRELAPGEWKKEMREGYKALNGRKPRSKRKMGGGVGRDKGGAAEDDSRFDAPW